MRNKPSNPFEERLLDSIEKHGWHCISVVAEDEGYSFTYSIGLFSSYGHPEVIVFGFGADFAHELLSDIAAFAAEGLPLDMGLPSDQLLEGFSCVFLEVPPSGRDRWALSAKWYYEDADFPLYQLVWPSTSGFFPWDSRADASFLQSQPVLGDVPASQA